MNKKSVLRAVFIFAFCMLLVVSSGFALAGDGARGDGDASILLSATDVEQLLDRLIQQQLANGDIPGATVAVVADGGVLLAKGYGAANVDRGTTVDGSRTLFRIGSLSKLFVWTAVMQLVEQGRLNLDADVNDYLDFKIPNRLHGRSSPTVDPITLKHLMSHSAGFEDVADDLFHLREEQTLPLDEYIRTHVPARVFPPGEVSAYSNYGSALAGYIVERVSGLPFAQYVEQNIFAPLRMERSTFRQPVEADLAQDVATGYGFVDGQLVPGDFVYTLGPAGGMSSTAADMARFMLAHLQGGTVDGRRILSEDTVGRMHSPLFTQHAAVDGMAHGFLEQSRNGQRMLYHMGSVLIFNSGLYLLPETDVGLFVSFNGGDHLAPMAVMRGFVDELYPGGGEAANAAAVPADAAASGTRLTAEQARASRRVAGEYHINRRSFTTDAGLLSLLEALRVEVEDDGYLYVTHFGQRETFVQTESGVYRNVDADKSLDPYGDFATIVFKEGSDGTLHLLSDGPMSYMRAPLYRTGGFTLAAVLLPVLVLLGTTGGWIVRAVVRRVRGRIVGEAVATKVGRWVGGAFAFTAAGLLAGALGVTGNMEPAYGVPQSYFGIEPDWAPLLDVLPPLMTGLALGMTLFCAFSWRRKLWGVGGRIYYSFMTVCAVALLAVLRLWHVI